ncbi:hypothetical protein GCM10009603_46550 [Nocardiopsis exhalans]
MRRPDVGRRRRTGPRGVAFDRDRAVALLFDELLEELVADLAQGVLAVGGLAQGEDPGPVHEEPQDGGGCEGMGAVRDVSIHTFDGIAELSIET